MKATTLIGGIVLAIGMQIVMSAELAVLDPAQPYSAERRSPIMYDAELLVTVTAPHETKLLRVWLPIPPSAEQPKFAWMTAQRFRADSPAKYPFTDIDSLREWIVKENSKTSGNSGASK